MARIDTSVSKLEANVEAPPSKIRSTTFPVHSPRPTGSDVHQKAEELEIFLQELTRRACVLHSTKEPIKEELTRTRKQLRSVNDSLQAARNRTRYLEEILLEGDVSEAVRRQCESQSREIDALRRDLEKEKREATRALTKADTLKIQKRNLEEQVWMLQASIQSQDEEIDRLTHQLQQHENSAICLNTFLVEQASRQLQAREKLKGRILQLERQLREAEANGYLNSLERNVDRQNPFIDDPGVIQVDPKGGNIHVSRLSSVRNEDKVDEKETDAILSVSPFIKVEERRKPVFNLRALLKNRHSKALYLAFQYLEVTDLLQVMRVCRQWRNLALHPSLWRRVYLSGDSIGPNVLEKLSEWCTETEYLYLEGLGNSLAPAEFDEDLISYNARIINLFERGFDKLLRSASHHVKSVTISDCGWIFTERCLWFVSRYCSNLEHFAYVGNDRPVTPESLWSLAMGCPNLKSLRVPPVPLSVAEQYFTDDCLAVIGQSWPRLTSVGLGGAALTLPGIANLIKACPRLRQFEIEHIGGLSEKAIAKMCRAGLKGLEDFRISFTQIEAPALRYLLGACPRLESISIHVGISDYFADTKDPKSIAKFKKEMDQLRALQREDLKGILELKDSYG